MPKDFEEAEKSFSDFKSGRHLSISNINNLDSNILITDESENSSSFSLNKSSYSNNDSSHDESISPCRQSDHAMKRSCNNLIQDKEESRKSSISPPTWKQRHTNSFQRSLRRFHSAFIVKNILSNINKTSESEINVEDNNKNSKVR